MKLYVKGTCHVFICLLQTFEVSYAHMKQVVTRTHLTFFIMFLTGSTTLRASTVPQVTLGNKGVNAK